MKLYNTLSKKIEDFIPHSEVVTMYTCGPTVYYYAHIGNLRSYIFEDILEKALVYNGYNVKRVMNITDVGHMANDSDYGDDKMLSEANKEHKTVWEIADFYTAAFFADFIKLNIKKPVIVKKATAHIDEYIKIISNLIDQKIAYLADGNVYFDISKAKDYYLLSGKNSEDLMVGVRETVSEDLAKKNAADFGLWFTKSKFENQLMQWDSPWGRGYPGWHIECSGLAIKYLGEYLDIHCGGVDNIFPHHTNEIAQSEAYLGHKWCNYWVHGEHLNDLNGKMSKSSGESLYLSLLLNKGYNPLAYRFLCLQSHYRKQLIFTFEALDEATNTYNKLLARIKTIKDNPFGELDSKMFNQYYEQFKIAIGDDLNTANALTTIYDVLKSDLNNLTKLALIKSFDQVLSLDLVQEETIINDDLASYIDLKIKERNLAKANHDYALSDLIRDELKGKGVIIKDTKEGTIYEIVK